MYGQLVHISEGYMVTCSEKFGVRLYSRASLALEDSYETNYQIDTARFQNDALDIVSWQCDQINQDIKSNRTIKNRRVVLHNFWMVRHTSNDLLYPIAIISEDLLIDTPLQYASIFSDTAGGWVFLDNVFINGKENRVLQWLGGPKRLIGPCLRLIPLYVRQNGILLEQNFSVVLRRRNGDSVLISANPDGKFALSSDAERCLHLHDNVLSIWDIRSSRKLVALNVSLPINPDYTAYRISYSPDELIIYVAYYDKIRDVTTVVMIDNMW